MRDYPKHLNSRADYEYVMEHFDSTYWLNDLKGLLASIAEWAFVGKLDSREDGVEDATHKIGEQRDDKTDTVYYVQYELRDNPQAKLFRIGFTVDEVKALIAGAEN